MHAKKMFVMVAILAIAVLGLGMQIAGAQEEALLSERLQVGDTWVLTNSSVLNIRSTPSTSGAIVGEIPGGSNAQVEILEVNSDDPQHTWVRTNHDGTAGWIALNQGNTWWASELEELVIQPTPTTEAVTTSQVEECQYEGTGSPQPEEVLLEIEGGMYVFDPSTTGCAWIAEGRFPWQDNVPEMPEYLTMKGIEGEAGAWILWDVHHIVGNNVDIATLNELDPEIPLQYRNWLVCAECSVWFYDPTWNMNNLDTPKPSIAEEFEAAKLQVMTDEGYLFPRVIWTADGNLTIYYEDSSGAQFYTTGCTMSTEPERIAVRGLKVDGGYMAAVGKTDCITVAWIDEASNPEVWEGQRDAARSVQYTESIEAWMMPSSWSQDQIDAWIASR